MPEISDFSNVQTLNLRTLSKIPRQYHFSTRTVIFPSVHSHRRDIFRKELKKYDPCCPAIEPWYPGVEYKYQIPQSCVVPFMVEPVYGFPLLR
jgi:hypothetical protein